MSYLQKQVLFPIVLLFKIYFIDLPILKIVLILVVNCLTMNYEIIIKFPLKDNCVAQ